jgi:hypothetical protein
MGSLAVESKNTSARRVTAMAACNPQQSYPQEIRDQVLSAYLKCPSIRGLERIFGINRLTITSWIKKSTACQT